MSRTCHAENYLSYVIRFKGNAVMTKVLCTIGELSVEKPSWFIPKIGSLMGREKWEPESHMSFVSMVAIPLHRYLEGKLPEVL